MKYLIEFVPRGLFGSSWLGFLLVIIAFPSTAFAQATDNDVGDKVGFLDLFPALRTLPAPAILQPGLRVSLGGGAATGGGGPAGGGVIQYDVLTVDGGQVLLQQSNYGDLGTGVRLIATAPARGYPALGPFWIHPSVLVGAESKASATLSITRYAKTLPGGTSVNVVRFQSQTSRGKIVTEYSEGSGLMVFDSISAGASDAQQSLIVARQLQLPWPLGRAPNWVQSGVRLDFAGFKRTTITNSTAIDEPAEYTFTFSQVGARWSASDVTFRIGQTAAGNGASVTGQGQLVGGLWLPQTALQVQFPTDGVLLDTDPVTGAQIFGGRGDDNSIIIQEILPAGRTTSFYDPVFGALLRNIVEASGPAASEMTDVTRTTSAGVLTAAAGQPPVPEDPPREARPGGGDGGGGGCGAAGENIAWWLGLLGALASFMGRRTSRNSS